MAEVRLESISKVYPGKVVAVDDLSLHIRDGELLVLVGPSGCGKTTTLRMIAGLEELSSGTIRIGDRVVNTLHPKDRDVAMVFQDYALYPHMTVYKNMAFGLKMRKVPRTEIDRIVRETAAMLGLSDLLDRKPGALSGGQQQRVAVGRAIVRNPKCYLFDEPLSNLDARLRLQMRAELKALHLRLKTTTIYVTHDQEEAMTLGDRVVVMSQGKMQQIGEPLEIYHRPVNRFVAGFVGTPPMNFLDGRLERRDGRLWFGTAAGLCLPLAPKTAEAAAPHLDDKVVAGIRPEAMRIDPSAGSSEVGSIHLKVVITEPLGDRIDVYGRTDDGANLIVRLSNEHDLAPGMGVQVQVDPSCVHLFEPGEYGRHIVFGR